MKTVLSFLALIALLFVTGCTTTGTNPASTVVTAVVGDLTTPAGIKDTTETATVLVLSANPDKVVIVGTAATALKLAVTDGTISNTLIQGAIDKLLSGCSPIVAVLARQKLDAVMAAVGGVPATQLAPDVKLKVNAFADGLLAGVADVSRAVRSLPAS